MARSIVLVWFILSWAGLLPAPGYAWAFFLFGLIVMGVGRDWKLFLIVLILIVATEAGLCFLISPSVYARFSYWIGGSGALCNLV